MNLKGKPWTLLKPQAAGNVIPPSRPPKRTRRRIHRLCTGVRIGRADITGASCTGAFLCIAVIALAAAVMLGCGDAGSAMRMGRDPGYVPGAAADVLESRRTACTGSVSGLGHPEGASRSAEGGNLFGLDLYSRLKARRGNLLFSPCSISAALSMLYAGAGGRTREEMASTLHLDQGGIDPHVSISVLRQGLIHKDAAGSLDIAHALWMQEGNEYRREYLELLRQRCGAGAFMVDFSAGPGAARERINAWVAERTRGKITVLLEEGMVHAGTELVAADAIHFSGRWLAPFDREDTRNRAFRIGGDETVQTPFMHREAMVRTLACDEGDMIEIPFETGAFSLIILLPREGADLAALEKGMLHEGFGRQLDRLAGSPEIRAKLSLPRFAVADGHELADTLDAMGMGSAFTPEADFSGIAVRKNLVLTTVVHKACLEMREEGVEAAAASGAVMTKGSGTMAVFVADRPFVFIIRENETGLFLFLGRLVDPRG